MTSMSHNLYRILRKSGTIRITEGMSCEESASFFTNLAHIPQYVLDKILTVFHPAKFAKF